MSGKVVGYVRVSSVGQNEARQLDGIDLDKTFTDQASGKSKNRPQLKEMIEYVREGDEIVVHSLDRLARNLDDLRSTVSTLTGNGVSIRFIKEGLTFTGEDSAMSNLLLSVMGAFAEFERSLIRERQAEGIAKAKRKGVYRGGKPAFTKTETAEIVAKHNTGVSVTQLAADNGVTRQTIHRYIKHSNQPLPPKQKPATTPPPKPSPPKQKRERVQAGRSVKPPAWVVELSSIDTPEVAPIVWSGHTTRLGAERMVASLEKEWFRWQSRTINERWIFTTAEPKNRLPLFAKRAEAVHQAGVQATDQPPPDSDAVIANQPIDTTQTELVMTGTKPAIINIPDRFDGTGNHLYVNNIYQYLFGPTQNISYEIFDHTKKTLDNLDCEPGKAWTIPATRIYLDCSTSSHLQNLTQLAD